MLTDYPPMILLVLGALAVLGLLALVRLLGTTPRSALPYRRKPVLSPWERKALPGLLRQLPPGCHLCPQVRLAELLAVTARDPSARQTALNRVASKSVDFVVVDVASGDARLVIALADRSHDRPDRRARDALVDAAHRVAGLPLARVRPGQRLDISHHLQAFASTQLEAAASTRQPRFA